MENQQTPRTGIQQRAKAAILHGLSQAVEVLTHEPAGKQEWCSDVTVIAMLELALAGLVVLVPFLCRF
jgi:hypothetical protein